MQARLLVLLGAAIATLGICAVSARADHDHDRGWHREYHHPPHFHPWVYSPPPVYVPPPAYVAPPSYYVPPPPVYYAPAPSLNFSFSIP